MRLVLLIVLVACSTAPRGTALLAGGSSGAPSMAIAPEQTAGMYWIPYVTCDPCTPPAAIVAYVTPDPDRARAIVAALDRELAFGLPYVVHTDELGVEPRGIAIVSGSYGTRAAAVAAAATMPAIGADRVTAIDLVTDVYANAGRFPDEPHHVTVVDRGPAVPAWSKADVDAVSAAMEGSDDPDAHQTLESEHRWTMRQLQQRRPACQVKPGELFVVEDRELQGYALAPVRCGGKLAYIEWTSSLLGHAVIVPDRAGYRLYQVVGAACDSPIIESWIYDREGRHRAAPASTIVASAAGC